MTWELPPASRGPWGRLRGSEVRDELALDVWGQLSKFSWRLPEAHQKVPLPADTLKAPVNSEVLG